MDSLFNTAINKEMADRIQILKTSSKSVCGIIKEYQVS